MGAAPVRSLLRLPGDAEPAERDGPGRRARLVVVDDRRGRMRARVGRVGALAGALLFVAMLGAALFHILLVEGQARLDRIEEERAAVESDLLSLHSEVAELRRPDRVIAEATAIGMAAAETIEPITADSLQLAPAPDPGAADSGAVPDEVDAEVAVGTSGG